MTRPQRDFACLAGLLFVFACAVSVRAQTYRNTSNRPFATVSNGPQEAIIVDIDGVVTEKIHATVVDRVRQVERAMTERAKPFIEQLKKRKRMRQELVWPITHVVMLRKDGKLLAGSSARRQSGVGAQDGDITIQFSAVLGETFPQAWQDLFNNVLTQIKPLLNASYGTPFQGGPVLVVNYDTTIGDRDAVVGGIYLVSDPAHNNQPTILFPQYNGFATGAVNFTNLIVHAYHGPAMLQYDAWEQGFARAMTMRVARQLWPDSNPFSDGTTASAVLDGTYEARYFYDWWNQPSLGNSVFIAPTLRQPPIVGGFTGGPFLTRYMMAGSAWAKVLTQYPNFFLNFNTAYYADTSVKGNVPALLTLAQTQAATVEGLAFSDWFKRQFVLDSSVQIGRKLHTTVFPLADGLQTGETGVYVLLYNYFSTDPTGDETLLTGVAFPIYWTFDFARMSLGPQYERADISGGSAALAPSFTEDIQYITIDTPVADVVSRLVLPLGTVATSAFSNNFFGTVLGLTTTDQTTGKQGTVTLTLPSGDQGPFDVVRGAFGATITGLDVPVSATLTIRDLNNNVVATRTVDTGTSTLALHTQLNQATSVTKTNNPFPSGIQMITVPILPFERDAAKIFGIADPGQFLFARWRQDLFNYALYPSTPPIQPGYGYYMNLATPINPGFTVTGLRPPLDQPYAVPLQVGWNQIGNPLLSLDTDQWDLTQVMVQHGADDPKTWADASDNTTGGAWVGQDIFEFDQSQSDPDSGSNNVAVAPFQTWRGYWVRVLVPEGVTLLFSKPTQFGPHRAAFTPRKPAGWSVDLTLTSAKGDKSRALIGADSKAAEGYDGHDVPFPPAFGSGGLQLAMPHEDWAAHRGAYYADIRPDGKKEIWLLSTSGLVKGQSYTLTWPALSTMKREVRLTLTDAATSRRVNMRSQSTFSFTADGATRDLRIDAEPRMVGGLQIASVTVVSSRGGTSISFATTLPASVTADVVSITGKRVRQLMAAGATPLDAGLHTLSWDWRDQRGVNLPPGQYLLSLQAVADDGTVARAARPIVVKR